MVPLETKYDWPVTKATVCPALAELPICPLVKEPPDDIVLTVTAVSMLAPDAVAVVPLLVVAAKDCPAV
jgi:hypothetical protein